MKKWNEVYKLALITLFRIYWAWIMILYYNTGVGNNPSGRIFKPGGLVWVLFAEQITHLWAPREVKLLDGQLFHFQDLLGWGWLRLLCGGSFTNPGIQVYVSHLFEDVDEMERYLSSWHDLLMHNLAIRQF